MPSLLLAVLLAPPLKSTQADFWTISVAYPRFSAGGSAARLANARTRAREAQLFRDFLKRAQVEVPSLKGKTANAQYELTNTPHRITDRSGLASGYVERYDYLAGAHGTTRYEAFNYGPRGALRLQDLFRRGVDGRAQASRALVGVMKGMKDVPTNVDAGEWTGLSAAQTGRFVVGKLGVLFLFDQYDVGVGAEGAPKVLVPWAKLPGVDRRGVLRPLF